MNKLGMLVLSVFVGMSLTAGCQKSGATIAGKEVVVATDRMDVHFACVQAFAETYMIFGGWETNQKGAISKVGISGLSMDDARPIYAMYPDFHLCKSAGAPLAQKAIRQLDIVPANSKALRELKTTLAGYKAKQRGEQVCVKLEGKVLKLTSAIVRGANEDILDRLPPQMRHEYYLVESAEIVDTQTALVGG